MGCIYFETLCILKLEFNLISVTGFSLVHLFDCKNVYQPVEPVCLVFRSEHYFTLELI